MVLYLYVPIQENKKKKKKKSSYSGKHLTHKKYIRENTD